MILVAVDKMSCEDEVLSIRKQLEKITDSDDQSQAQASTTGKYLTLSYND